MKLLDFTSLLENGRTRFASMSAAGSAAERAARIAAELHGLYPTGWVACVLREGDARHAVVLNEQGAACADVAGGLSAREGISGVEPPPGRSWSVAAVALADLACGEIALAVQGTAAERAALQAALNVWGSLLALRLAGANSRPDGQHFQSAAASELMGPVLHEFNNFLNMTVLEVAVLESDLSPEQAQDVGTLRTQATRVAGLVREFQRYRDVRRPPSYALDLHEVLRRAVGALARLSGAKPLTVHLHLDATCPRVQATQEDIVCLAQFLVHQVAATGRDEAPEIDMHTRSADGRVTLRVASTAATSPEAEDVLEAHEDPLLNLQLAACRSIVRRLQGKLRAARDGAAFVVDLPCST